MCFISRLCLGPVCRPNLAMASRERAPGETKAVPHLTIDRHRGCPRRLFVGLALVALWGCADLLGIPTDPALAPPVLLGTSVDAGGAPLLDGDREADPLTAPGQHADGKRSKRPLGPGDVGGLDESFGSDASAPSLGPPWTPARDAGAEPDSSSPSDASCDGILGRVPVDIVFLVDNSGSMSEEDAAFEAALPAFAARLDDDAMDYRIILLSRHRTEGRSESDQASTSVCIESPLSGVERCPSEAPVPSFRFFHYSTKLDAQDSFARALSAFSEPDPFALTEGGWSAWLRRDARKVFIEISDSDSATPGSDFLAALRSRSPEQFGTPEAEANLTFHSVVGVIGKLGLDAYGPSEPVEPRTCSGSGSSVDNAGEVYQELSRVTGGLRQPICPAASLESRLLLLAADTALRSVILCRSREAPDAG
jgi:hypothetical protein